jgi:uncharacterized membrane protein YhaH (DUF805 family)
VSFCLSTCTTGRRRGIGCHAGAAEREAFVLFSRATCGAIEPEDLVTGRIFISYRRGDDQAAAGRLYDRLLQHFDHEQLFIDVEAVEPGVDFVKSLDEQVAACVAFIAVIGPRWLNARNKDGNPRLDNPTDYVRVEIESALKRDIRVIPVLVDGASMPQASDLPPSLQALARRNAVEIAHHRFAADCDDLARRIKQALGVPTKPSAPAQLFVSSSVPQEKASAQLSWPQILFSFKGRLSRMQFLIGFIFTLAFAAALFGAIALTIESFFQAAQFQTEEVTTKLSELLERRLLLVVTMGSWWPALALILKRLHDLEQGWKALLVFVALDALWAVFHLLNQDEPAQLIAGVDLGLTLMLAIIKGSVGPNRYGPDPLGKR